MDLGLRGKRALVTGASRGIGRAIAEGLAAEGCSLMLSSRDPDRLSAAAHAIARQYGVAVSCEPGDLSQQADVERVGAAAGDVDILVNNAGAIPNGSLEEMDIASWRTAWDLKVFGYIALSQIIYPRLVARGRGVVLNIIGIAGERPWAGYILGSTGNAALYTFTRALGADSFDRGVRVLAVSPGYVETDRQRTKMRNRAEAEFGDAERWREFSKALPQERMADPKEIADVAVFMASDRAAYMSGTVVTVDGGMAARPMPL
jgi:NAD(P)-dependent dehydrogenase (short-subunit alcohol dehydrogenase family)